MGNKRWVNTWTEVEDLGGGKRGATISMGHRVFFDKADHNLPKKHKVTDNRPDHVLIQSAKCCVEVHPFYAKYFDVQHEEVRLYEERWVVQRWRDPPGKWQDIGAWNPVITAEEYPEPAGDVVKVTVTYDTDYGILTVEYFQRDGDNLKHNVSFTNTSGSTKTFRVVQAWVGIAGSKCNGKDVPEADDAPFLAFHNADKPQKKFNIAENLSSMIFNEDGTKKTDQCLQQPVQVESHANGMKADFIYAQWVLAQNESLEIDPDTATLNNPTEDGYATLGNLGGYGKTTTESGAYSGVPAYYSSGGGGQQSRGFFEWNTSGISDGSTITDTVFKYHGSGHSFDAHIHEIVGYQPSTLADGGGNGNYQTFYDELGQGTVYVDPAGFPVVAINQTQDLGVAADADLQALLVSDWFGFSMQADTEGVAGAASIWGEEHGGVTPPPTLYVEYIPPPSAPKSSSASALIEAGVI